jgi:hypothetical protein
MARSPVPVGNVLYLDITDAENKFEDYTKGKGAFSSQTCRSVWCWFCNPCEVGGGAIRSPPFDAH